MGALFTAKEADASPSALSREHETPADRAAIDAALPLAERFDIPAATVRAVAETRARGGRVIAVGTTVVRALEGAASKAGGLRAGPGETDLMITPAFRPRVVDGILSGAHAAHESHFSLLAAFAGPALLAAAAAHAERAGFLTHELGDSMLVLPGALAVADTRARHGGSVVYPGDNPERLFRTARVAQR